MGMDGAIIPILMGTIITEGGRCKINRTIGRRRHEEKASLRSSRCSLKMTSASSTLKNSSPQLRGRGREAPVKPSKNVTLDLIVAPFEMLPSP